MENGPQQELAGISKPAVAVPVERGRPAAHGHDNISDRLWRQGERGGQRGAVGQRRSEELAKVLKSPIYSDLVQ